MKHNQLARRALWLLQRAHKRRSVRKLEAARHAFEDVLEIMSPHHPDRPSCLSNLSTALRLQYEWTSDSAALDRLMEVDELITQSLSEEHPQRNLHRHNLRNVLTVLVAGPRQPGLLARAVPLAREAAADPAHRSVFVEALIVCLDELYERTEDATVLLELIALDRERVTSVPADDPEVGAFLSDLGAGLRTFALLTGPRRIWRRPSASGCGRSRDVRPGTSTARSASAAWATRCTHCSSSRTGHWRRCVSRSPTGGKRSRWHRTGIRPARPA